MPSHQPSATPQQASALAGFDVCKQSLLSVIETQIVPQLVQAHADFDQPSSAPEPANTRDHVRDETSFFPSQNATVEFAHLCCEDDEYACHAYIEQLIAQHNSTPSLLLHLITPAARYLGKLWTQDRLDFSHVTIGLIRMQNITHHYGFLNRRLALAAGHKRRVLVAAAPGSQHLLGLAMVSEFFVQAGWDVTVEVARTEQELLQAAGNDWFDVLGLSVGLMEQLEGLPRLVAALRTAALNPGLVVMAGGAAFSSQTCDAQPFQPSPQPNNYGCDVVTSDPVMAVEMAAKLVLGVTDAGMSI